jgi:hypothetical protein
LSFAVGWPNWWLALPLVILAAAWVKNKLNRNYGLVVAGLLIFSGITLILTHERSTPAWLSLPFLAIVQFPWRFLGPTIFFLSFASGALLFAKYRLNKFVFVVIVALSIGLNFNYFRPQYYFTNETDTTKLSGEEFIIQQKSAILDYLPKTAPVAPKEEALAVPVVASGSGQIQNYSKRSNSFFFDADVYKPAEIQVPVMYFPGWKVINAGQEIPIYPKGDYGLITFKLPEGHFIIQGRFTDTTPRTAGNVITVISLSAIFVGLALEANRKKKK